MLAIFMSSLNSSGGEYRNLYKLHRRKLPSPTPLWGYVYGIKVFPRKGNFSSVFFNILSSMRKKKAIIKTNFDKALRKKKAKPTLSQSISTQSYYIFLAGTRAFVPTRHFQAIILSVEFRRRRRRVLSGLRRRRAKFSR